MSICLRPELESVLNSDEDSLSVLVVLKLLLEGRGCLWCLFFWLDEAPAATGFAIAIVLLALASCCCAPPLPRLLVRYCSGFETRGYMAIVVGFASLALVSFA